MPAIFWTVERLTELKNYGRSGGDWNAKPTNWQTGWSKYATISDRAARAKARTENPRSRSNDDPIHHLDRLAMLTPLSSNERAVPRPIGADVFAGVKFPDSAEARRDRGSGGGIARPDWVTYTGATL